MAPGKAKLPCPYGSCEFVTVEAEVADGMRMLEMHERASHPRPEAGEQIQQPVKTEKVKRPQLVVKDGYVSEEAFGFFQHNWGEYKKLAAITTAVKQHLASCLGEEISELLYSKFGAEGYEALTEEGLMEAARGMVVKSRNKLVMQLQLQKMMQGPDQPVQTYVANLKATARTCGYRMQCTDANCNKVVDYTDAMVLQQMIRGLADDEIQRKLLAKTEMTLGEAEKFVMAEESGKWSQADSKSEPQIAAGLSTYKSQQIVKPKPCSRCGGTAHIEEDDCPAAKAKCRRCEKIGHYAKVCRTVKKEKLKKEETANALPVEALFQLKVRASGLEEKNKTRVLPHMVFDRKLGKYVAKKGGTAKRLDMQIAVDEESFRIISPPGVRSPTQLRSPKDSSQTSVAGTGDTGATICCTGTEMLKRLGIMKFHLFKTEVALTVADKRVMTILGVMPVNITVRRAGSEELAHTKQLLYFVKELRGTFISKDALQDLGIISEWFPQVPPPSAQAEVAGITATDQAVCGSLESEVQPMTAPCGCPTRRSAPPPPALPMPATEGNKGRLKKYLLDYYRSSTFNVCPHQPLPLMQGPPLRFIKKPDSKPFAVYSPATVPAHWAAKVKEDIDRDVRLGVLEKVEPGMHNQVEDWCHRMVLGRKHNGDPRRTVDLSPLNDQSVRQCHPTAPPLQQATTVPKHQKKTTLDAWNGFHSVKIREEDRHLTTFLTPWGRYCYRTAPQGYKVSGDAYTARYDRITIGVKKMRRVIDDTLLYEDNVEKAFHQVAEYLSLVGQNGIILNPDKFEFAEDKVSWAGVRLTEDKVAPIPEHVTAIKQFPTPTSITDLRSYFALVNQVAPYYAVQPVLQPFRELLRKNVKFYWDEVLQSLFEQSREVIADEVIKGVYSFEVGRWTCVMTDWCRSGIGYMLVQKYCSCSDISPICCLGGWKVCMVGSRFTSPAEQNYSAVEGELQAVVDGLHKTRYYTQGCEKLLVGVDHKPLLGLLQGKKLEDIDNMRLRRMKEKTFGWNFRVVHIPGRKNVAPDAMSRGVPPGEVLATLGQVQLEGEEEMTCREVRSHMLAMLRTVTEENLSHPDEGLDASGELLASMNNGVRSVTWEQVKVVVAGDTDMTKLVDWIQGGCLGAKDDLPMSLQEYWGIRDNLHVSEGVALYGGRTIIPRSLREDVLKTLHSAHQGVTGMTLRAGVSVYWPGITSDIQAVRDRCMSCNRTAPTQAKLPPVTPIVPQYPFEHICMDYMTLDGHNYGVFVDRFTNWAGVYFGTSATDVVTVLSKLCEDYGIPVTCTTDGGPQYTAEVVRKFMKDYGIEHRLCSVANAHANTRAELAVKTIKRMIRDCRGIGGKLDGAKFSQAILQYRNTPDRDTKLSPASALFGRQLRDFIPSCKMGFMGNVWKDVAEAREKALASRGQGAHEQWSAATKELPPLQISDHVMIQNQTGNNPRRWDKRGVVVAVLGYDQYQVRVDGSRRLTLRNRRFLRKYKVVAPSPFNTIPVEVDLGPDDRDQQQAGLGDNGMGGGEVPRAPEVTRPAVPERTDSTGPYEGEAPAGHLLNHQAGEVAEPGGVPVLPEIVPVRRSSRATKGVTSRYKDFVE